MTAYAHALALALYTPPPTALAFPRVAQPIPDAVPLTVAYASWRYEIGQEVVVPSTHYVIGRHWETMEVTRYQLARIVGRYRHGGTPLYVVHYGRREGSVFGYKAFGYVHGEDEISLDMQQAITVERRIVPTTTATATRTAVTSVAA